MAATSKATKQKQIDATANCDHGRKVHVHGRPDHDQVAVVLQSGPKNKRRYFGEGNGVAAYMSRTQARKIHRALGRILEKR